MLAWHRYGRVQHLSSNSIFIHGFHLNFYLPCCLHTVGPGCYQLLSFLFQRLIIVVIVAVHDWHSHRVFAFIISEKLWPGGQMVVMAAVGGVRGIPRRWNATCVSTIFLDFFFHCVNCEPEYSKIINKDYIILVTEKQLISLITCMNENNMAAVRKVSCIVYCWC